MYFFAYIQTTFKKSEKIFQNENQVAGFDIRF